MCCGIREPLQSPGTTSWELDVSGVHEVWRKVQVTGAAYAKCPAKTLRIAASKRMRIAMALASPSVGFTFAARGTMPRSDLSAVPPMTLGDRPAVIGNVVHFTDRDSVPAIDTPAIGVEATRNLPMEPAETPEDRAARYKRTAAQLRQQADGSTTGESAELLIAADQYERIADRLLRCPNRPRGSILAL